MRCAPTWTTQHYRIHHTHPHQALLLSTTVSIVPYLCASLLRVVSVRFVYKTYCFFHDLDFCWQFGPSENESFVSKMRKPLKTNGTSTFPFKTNVKHNGFVMILTPWRDAVTWRRDVTPWRDVTPCSSLLILMESNVKSSLKSSVESNVRSKLKSSV